MNVEHLLWTEKYRPKTVEECILPDRIKQPFIEYVKSKEIPHLLLHGGPGIGKTTIAKAMCSEIGCDNIIINGSDESGIDTFRTKIKNYASTLSLSDTGRKVLIIDEADYLNPNSTQPALRNAMEEYAQNCSFIFTANFKDRIIKPLHSRCAVIDFTLTGTEKQKMASSFLKRIITILTDEKVEFKKEVVIEIVKKYFPDFRRVLNELQRYSKFGAIDAGILSTLGDVEINNIISKLKEKDFASLRKWTANNDIDPVSFYRKLYDNLAEHLKDESVPQMVLILADYQYKGAFVADQEVHIMALLTELMVQCEFK